jgi:hypothetical protein
MNLVPETTNKTRLHAVLNLDNEEQHCMKRMSMITTQPADTMRLSCSPHIMWPVWQQMNIIFTRVILAWIPLLLQWNDQFHKYSLIHKRTKPNRNHTCWFTYKTPIEKNSWQLHAWTFIQKWQSAGSLWYKWENPRKINESAKDFDFPHLRYFYL